MSLFKEYEKKPDAVSAVDINYDTMERIARYYAENGYDYTLERNREGMKLHLEYRSANSGDIKSADIEISFNELKPQVLLYGHPPTVVSSEEFYHTWREPKK